MSNKILEGQIGFNHEDALKLLQRAYDICSAAVLNNGIKDQELRDNFSNNATKLDHIIAAISQQVFECWSAEFQEQVEGLKTAVEQVEAGINELQNEVQNADKACDFAQCLDSILTIAVGIAKSFH